MKNYFSEIFYLLGKARKRLPILIILFVLSSILDLIGLGIVAPYVSLVLNISPLDGMLGDIVGIFGITKNHETILIILGLFLFITFLLKAIAVIAINWSIVSFSLNQQTRLRSILMNKYQNMPYIDYLTRNSSEYIHQIQNLTAQYSSAVVLPLLRMLSDGIVGVVIISLLAWNNGPALLLMIFLFGSFVIIYDLFFRNKLRSYGKLSNEALQKVIKGVQEGIRGLKEIRTLRKEEYFYSKVYQGAKQYALNHTKNQVISSSPRYLLEFTMICFVVFLVIITILIGGSLQNLAPTLALFGVAALRLLPMINNFSTGFLHLRYNRHAVSQLYLDMKNIKSRNANNLEVLSNTINQNLFKNIILEKVNFSYPNTTFKALDQISLEIKVGESVGLIGASGCGKTTLVNLLLSLLEPESGNIKYNNMPLNKNTDNWLSQIAYLPQDVFLIDNTLECNVALGLEEDEIDRNNLNEAIKQARLEDLINTFAKGTKTIIGEQGIRLSGGQRQRVALARAFYHNRNVLVMDEATSALDNETELEVINEIKQLKGKKTLIVIAHRLTTVQHCDVVYKMEKGKIISSGNPSEIISSS